MKIAGKREITENHLQIQQKCMGYYRWIAKKRNLTNKNGKDRRVELGDLVM